MKRYVTTYVLEKLVYDVRKNRSAWEQWQDWPSLAAARRGLLNFSHPIEADEWGKGWRMVRVTVETVRARDLEAKAAIDLARERKKRGRGP